MKKTFFDGAKTRTALLGVDDGWHESYWYGQRPDAKPRLLGKVIRLFRAVRDRHVELSVGRHVSAMPQHHSQDFLTAREG